MFAPRPAGQRGVDPARQHRVDLDVVLGPGAGHGLGHLHDAALGRSVGCREPGAEDRHHRADHDDLAATCRQHRRIGRLRAHEGAGEVGVDDLVPFVQAVFLGLLSDVGAGVVDQDVEPAEAVHRGLDHRLAGRLLGEVALDGRGLHAQAGERFDGGGVLGGIAAGHHHPGTALRQPAGHAEADAAIATGHDRGLAAEVEAFHGCPPVALRAHPSRRAAAGKGPDHFGARLRRAASRFAKNTHDSCGFRVPLAGRCPMAKPRTDKAPAPHRQERERHFNLLILMAGPCDPGNPCPGPAKPGRTNG